MNNDSHLSIRTVTTAEVHALRHRRPPNSKYHVIFDPAVAEPDKWVSFPTSFVTGKTNVQKQVALHGAAANRGVKIKTRVRGEVMYMQYIGRTNAI